MDFDELEREAVAALSHIPSGQIFRVKDLFEGYRWEAISHGDRRDFGKQFKRHVNGRIIQNVIYTGKAQNGSAEYQKVTEEET